MVEDHIQEAWKRLRRNALDVALDTKVSEGARAHLYVPACESPDRINELIRERRKQTGEIEALEIHRLQPGGIIGEHGVLYLPYDYIVPGGRFNEMYGWDSYWIILGLLHDGLEDLAVGMVENFFYQIEHYGQKILNANRTYYLSRSQPPLLGPIVLSVLERAPDRVDPEFIRRAAAALATNYGEFWKKHRYTEKTGLFHYGHSEQAELGPCPEVVFGERDPLTQLSHYDKVLAHLRTLPEDDLLRLRFYNKEKDVLTPEAYAGDRGMRESGFDVSFHMGYCGLETHDFNPVCLNSLLYVQCIITADLHERLEDEKAAREFREEAGKLHAQIQKHLWNAEKSAFADYNHRLERSSDFPFLTMSYPFWAGIATAAQAESFRAVLPSFETPYGLQASPVQTGGQWNAPFMWAPLVYFTYAGLWNYGYAEEARRVARKFIDTVRRVFGKHGASYEKYNSYDGSTETAHIIDMGYAENVTGFGWTNGVVLELGEWMLLPSPPAPVSPARYRSGG